VVLADVGAEAGVKESEVRDADRTVAVLSDDNVGTDPSIRRWISIVTPVRRAVR